MTDTVQLEPQAPVSSTLIDLDTYKAAIRELRSDLLLDQQYERDIRAAHAEASNFVGFDVALTYTPSTAPNDLLCAIAMLAQRFSDAHTPEYANYLTGTAHALLRPYRADTGI